MINENGAICTVTEITAETQREIISVQRKKFIVLLTVSSVLSATYFVMLALIKPFPSVMHCLAVFIILTACSVIYLAGVGAALKKAGSKTQTMRIEFYSDYLTDVISENGVDICGGKTYYGELARITETRNYLVLYKCVNCFYAVDKNGLPAEELQALRNVLRSRRK